MGNIHLKKHKHIERKEEKKIFMFFHKTVTVNQYCKFVHYGIMLNIWQQDWDTLSFIMTSWIV